MKEDAPVPETVPAKRRQLEAALDRWLAVWLDRDDLTPSERRRVEAEKQRRRHAMPDVTVGFVVASEGATPNQNDTMAGILAGMAATATEVHHAGISRRLLAVLPDFAAVTEAGDFQAVVRAASVVIAAPKHEREPVSGEPGVWAAIRYARHRKVPVRVILPSGKEL